MIAAPAFLQILFFIVSLLAPPDTARITLAPKPSEAIIFTKNPAGSWVLNLDESEWKVEGEFVSVHPTKGDRKDERAKVAPFVGDAPDAARTLATHDWEKENSVKLSKALTVEKSDGGFIFHMHRSADEPPVDVHVVFTK